MPEVVHVDGEDAELEANLGDAFEEFAAGIAGARWALDAELHASEVLGYIEATLVDEGPVPSGARAEAVGLLLAQIAQYAVRQHNATGLAVLRTIAVFADNDHRGEIVAAADHLASSGVKDPVWAHTIGHPTVGRCWRLRDVFGSQESIHADFAYGRRRHGLAVLVDHELGGGVKDSWVASDPDRVWKQLRRDAEDNPVAELEEISWQEARDALLAATAIDPCPADPEQVQDVASFAHVLAARLALLPDPEEVLLLKVTLKVSKPPIWRRLEVPGDITLDRLHEVLQVAFGWHGGHLHAFQTPDRVYGDPDPDSGFAPELGVRLTRVAPVGETLLYTYDFGDDWQHAILVEKSVPDQAGVTYPRCTGGRRAAPPDDCGGIWRYLDLLEALADTPGPAEQHLAALDPSYFKAADVTAALAHLAHTTQ